MTSRAARGSLLAGLCLGLLLLAGCDIMGPGVGAPATLTPAPIPDDLAVGETITVAITVRDAETRPVPGVAVSWTPSTGTTVDPAANTSNENGVAFTRWSLATEPGQHTLVVRAGGLEESLTATTRSGS